MLDGNAVDIGNVHIQLRPEVSSDQMVENVRSALSRDLPHIRHIKWHHNTLAIASGGPSLTDTYQDLEGHVAAVNGSLAFLLDKGMVPHYCGVLDSSERMADIVVAHPRVNYLVASNCCPALFDKLLKANCKVYAWHTTPDSIGTDSASKLLKEKHPETWLQIGGGSTIGLRLINIGYVLGYRKFHLHGLDSSFRGTTTHAYPDRRDGAWAEQSSLDINGYPTSLNFLGQVTSFANVLAQFESGDLDPVDFTMFGDGLLQAGYRHYLAHKGKISPQEAFTSW